jgi:hypothetical protein
MISLLLHLVHLAINKTPDWGFGLMQLGFRMPRSGILVSNKLLARWFWQGCCYKNQLNPPDLHHGNLIEGVLEKNIPKRKGTESCALHLPSNSLN